MTKPANKGARVRTTANGTKVKMVSAHVPVDMLEQLRQRAEAETRSVSQQVLHYIKVGLSLPTGDTKDRA